VKKRDFGIRDGRLDVRYGRFGFCGFAGGEIGCGKAVIS
jgi:hypothetical protein